MAKKEEESKNDIPKEDEDSKIKAPSMFEKVRRNRVDSLVDGGTAKLERGKPVPSENISEEDDLDTPWQRDEIFNEVRNYMVSKHPCSISAVESLNQRINHSLQMLSLVHFRKGKIFVDEKVTNLKSLKVGDHIYYQGSSRLFVKYFHHMIVSKVDINSKVFEVIELNLVKTLLPICKTLAPSVKEVASRILLSGFDSKNITDAKQFFGDKAYEDGKEGAEGIIRTKAFIMSDDYLLYKKRDSSNAKWRKLNGDLMVREYKEVFNRFVIWFYQVAFGYKVKINISPRYRILRAKQFLGPHEYHLFRSNCEHFATWCCTGLFYSEQVHDKDCTLEGLRNAYHLGSTSGDYAIELRLACYRQCNRFVYQSMLPSPNVLSQFENPGISYEIECENKPLDKNRRNSLN